MGMMGMGILMGEKGTLLIERFPAAMSRSTAAAAVTARKQVLNFRPSPPLRHHISAVAITVGTAAAELAAAEYYYEKPGKSGAVIITRAGYTSGRPSHDVASAISRL